MVKKYYNHKFHSLLNRVGFEKEIYWKTETVAVILKDVDTELPVLVLLNHLTTDTHITIQFQLYPLNEKTIEKPLVCRLTWYYVRLTTVTVGGVLSKLSIQFKCSIYSL